jgi:lysophospholipase L1-like esterase
MMMNAEADRGLVTPDLDDCSTALNIGGRGTMHGMLAAAALLLSATACRASEPGIKIGLIGDSTVAEQSGWGPAFAGRFGPSAEVINHAKNGATLQALSNRLDALLDLEPDYVLIQFGHNDQKRYGTDVYGEHLRSYAARIRKAGGKPVILSPVTRRSFGEDGKITSNLVRNEKTTYRAELTAYAKAAGEVARELGLPFIDLHASSIAHHNRIGREESMTYNFKEGDRTHFNRKGAEAIVDLILEDMRTAVPEICARLKPGKEEAGGPLEPIRVSDDGLRFVRGAADEEFIVWGVNYDHDGTGRLLDEYWDDDWEAVVADFKEIKELGANCVRVHLQFGKFMEAPGRAHAPALDRLGKLVRLAEDCGLYLDVTGLACYHKKNIPEWYDPLGEQERWAAQAVFWESVASVCAGSPAIFCYDLMNEPILPGKEASKEWLAGELGGKFFVQRISLDLKGRSREEVAEAWVDRMVKAIRRHDDRPLITVGVIPWVFAFGGGQPLFHGPRVGKQLDFVAVHFYPKKGEVGKALEALKAYEVGKPLLIEEMFPMKCSEAELLEFVDRTAGHVDGWVSFYWGQTPGELRKKAKPSISEAITASWLEAFKAGPPGRESFPSSRW